MSRSLIAILLVLPALHVRAKNAESKPSRQDDIFSLNAAATLPAKVASTKYGLRPLVESQDKKAFWSKVPPELIRAHAMVLDTPIREGQVGKKSVDGFTEFEVTAPGYALLACYFGYEGNKSGNWTGTRLKQKDFVEQGWHVVEDDALGAGLIGHGRPHVLLWKWLNRGEKYNLRCNKYDPPFLIVLQNAAADLQQSTSSKPIAIPDEPKPQMNADAGRRSAFEGPKSAAGGETASAPNPIATPSTPEIVTEASSSPAASAGPSDPLKPEAAQPIATTDPAVNAILPVTVSPRLQTTSPLSHAAFLRIIAGIACVAAVCAGVVVFIRWRQATPVMLNCPLPLPDPIVDPAPRATALQPEVLSYQSPPSVPLLVYFSTCQHPDTGRALQFLGPMAMSGNDVTFTGRSAGITRVKLTLESRVGRAAAGAALLAFHAVLFGAIVLICVVVGRSFESMSGLWFGFCVASTVSTVLNNQRVVRVKNVMGESFIDGPRFILSIWMRKPEQRSGSWLIMRARSEADFESLVEAISPLLMGRPKPRPLNRLPLRSKLLITIGIASVLFIIGIVAVFGLRSFVS